jgi:PleD family two-component response regulator
MISNSTYDLSRLNVLVVDDNKHMVALVKSILHALRIRNIHDAGDGAGAFIELRQFLADMVICDMLMQPLDGIEFTRLVRNANDSPNVYVPIIMMTGYTERFRVIEARDAGVTEFLAKPLSARGLHSRIIEVIEHPRPFVRTATFFGPDRRRRQIPIKIPDRRVALDPLAATREQSLSQDEIEALMRS